MKKTLNNIIKLINDFANDHLMLNSFSFGDASDIANKEETAVKYPLLHCQVWDSTIDKTYISITFNCIAMDLVHKDESNQTEVLSDTIIILNHLFNYLNQSKVLHQDLITLETTGRLFPFYEKYRDEVSGWNLQLVIKIPNTGICNIPFNSTLEA